MWIQAVFLAACVAGTGGAESAPSEDRVLDTRGWPTLNLVVPSSGKTPLLPLRRVKKPSPRATREV